ncbi:MAG: hypothetical protein M1453_03110 [Acidobacteria bacterium]|nr:hypothetical protein [Acidobacteriota bacterium]MCL5286969.1 hypothetical protein [Acidobacteriota bacterium]
MKDIYSVLAEKQKQLNGLQKEIESLRVAARLLTDEHAPSDAENLSQPQMVVSILEANDKEMHVKDIAEQMKKKFKLDVKRNNLSVLLYRYSSRGRHFYKVIGKANTYGLLKWKTEEKRVLEMK